jgi:hypothetical protein
MHLIGRKELNSVARPAKWVVAVSLLAAFCLAACGTIPKLTTEQAVADSFSRLQSQSSISVAVSLGLSPNQIVTLSETHGGRPVPLATAKGLSEASIVFSMATGHGENLKSARARSDTANSYDVGLRVGASMPVEIRYVNQALYGRVQIAQLLQDFGAPASDGQSAEAALTHADRYVPGLAALAQGQWVTISRASLQSLLGMLKTFAGSSLGGQSSTNTGSMEASVRQLENSLKNTLKNNASYSNPRTSGGRTRYNVTVDLKSFVEQAGPAIQSFASSLPAGMGKKITNADIAKAASEVPAHATLQLYVKNDKAQEIVIDVNQFVPAKDKAPFAIPVQLLIGQPGPIRAPAGAHPLDLSNLGQIFGAMMGGSSGSSSATSTPFAS